MIDPKDISVVVQGAVNDEYTPKTLESIRKFLPGAVIILSTWKDCNTDNLDYDILIKNDDPGAPPYDESTKCFRNINRQLVSTLNGIRAVKTKYVLKFRTDLVLTGDDFIDYFDLFKVRFPEYKILNKRVIITNLYTILPEILPLHPCDFVFFGLKKDVEDIFDIPLAPIDKMINYFYEHELTARHKNKGYFHEFRHQYTPEQYIWYSFLKKHVSVDFKHMFDTRTEILRLTDMSFINNLIIISADQFCIKSLKTPEIATPFNYDFINWLKLYNKNVKNIIFKGLINIYKKENHIVFDFRLLKLKFKLKEIN